MDVYHIKKELNVKKIVLFNVKIIIVHKKENVLKVVVQVILEKIVKTYVLIVKMKHAMIMEFVYMDVKINIILKIVLKNVIQIVKDKNVTISQENVKNV